MKKYPYQRMPMRVFSVSPAYIGLFRDTVHKALDGIADIIKGNILCIVKITLILFPETPELIACADSAITSPLPELDNKTTADHSAAASCFFSTSTTFCAVAVTISSPSSLMLSSRASS